MLLFGVAGFYAYQTWTLMRANEWHYLSTAANITSNSINASFKHTQTALLNLADSLSINDASPSQADLKKIDQLFQRFKQANPELLNILLIAPSGQILISGNRYDLNNLPSVADDPSFQQSLAVLAKPDESSPLVDIARPIESRFGNGWLMAMRLGIYNQSRSRLLYILAANSRLSLQQSIWEGVTLPAGGSFGLLRDDAYLVSRYPVPDKVELRELYSKPRYGALVDYLRANGFPTEGHLEGYNSVAQEDYLFAFSRLKDFPISVFVTQPISNIRANWQSQLLYPLLLLSALIICSYFVTRLLVAKQRDHDQEQDRIKTELEKEIELRTTDLKRAKTAAEAANVAKSVGAR